MFITGSGNPSRADLLEAFSGRKKIKFICWEEEGEERGQHLLFLTIDSLFYPKKNDKNHFVVKGRIAGEKTVEFNYFANEKLLSGGSDEIKVIKK